MRQAPRDLLELWGRLDLEEERRARPDRLEAQDRQAPPEFPERLERLERLELRVRQVPWDLRDQGESRSGFGRQSPQAPRRR